MTSSPPTYFLILAGRAVAPSPDGFRVVPAPENFTSLDLYAVLQGLPSGVTLANADGRIVFSNASADRILGMGAATEATPGEWAEHYGVFLPDGQTPFPTGEYPLVRALSGEHTSDVEMVIRNASTPDGAIISVSGQPLQDADGRITGAAVIFRDITRLRKAERLKDELTGFIVHDLKNPLAAILLTCGSMEVSAIDEEQRADVITIREAAERLHRMVLDLLDLQLAEDGVLRLELASVALRPLLDEVAKAGRPRLQGRAQRLVVGEVGPLSVRADEPHIFRVLMNLIDNCAKYGSQGGAVTMDVIASGAHVIVIRVSDDGPGVPPNLRERIFEKYAQAERGEGMRSRDSRGLGLRFCKVIVAAHGGQIWVEDAVPRGARFCVELRLA